MPFSYSSYTKARMQRLFDTCIIAESKYSDVDKQIKQIEKGKDRYQAISVPYNIPWYVTGIVHKTFCNCDFKTHLSNGDSLNGRTVHVPVGHPKKGRPPFTWEQSAEDMFLYYRWDKWADWSLPGVLYTLETVTRFEQIEEDPNASKLWCFSNHFTSKDKEDLQKCGGAVLLRRMVEKHMVDFDVSYDRRLLDLKALGSEISFMPNRSLPKAIELQRLMNISGACLREDGRIGKSSASAYYELTREYLSGDPESTFLKKL